MYCVNVTTSGNVIDASARRRKPAHQSTLAMHSVLTISMAASRMASYRMLALFASRYSALISSNSAAITFSRA